MSYYRFNTSNLIAHQLDWLIFPWSSSSSFSATLIIFLYNYPRYAQKDYILTKVPIPATTPMTAAIGKLAFDSELYVEVEFVCVLFNVVALVVLVVTFVIIALELFVELVVLFVELVTLVVELLVVFVEFVLLVMLEPIREHRLLAAYIWQLQKRG